MLNTYHGFIILGILGAMLLLGVFLRAKISYFQSYLVPAAILGGIIGFLIINLGSFEIKPNDFIPFTMHAFSISFMSLCLSPPSEEKGNASGKKEFLRGVMWMALIWSTSFAMQAVVGAATLEGYNMLSGNTLDTAYGFLATHGFTQGPGQALAIGNIWEANFAIPNAASIGLLYANIGFIGAFLVGVPLARYYVSRGLNRNKQARITEVFLKGIYKENNRPVFGNETTHSANIDTLAVHISLLAVVYTITFYFVGYIAEHWTHIPILGNICNYGYFFLWGLGIALITRFIIVKLQCTHILDEGVQRHVTGSTIDIMLVASFMSVELAIVIEYIVPVTLVSIAIMITTFFFIVYFGKKSGNLAPERTVTMLGCCFGATGNGLLLLRILDPDYSTSVPMELPFFNVAITACTLHLMGGLAPLIPEMSTTTGIMWYGLSGIISCIALIFLTKYSPSEHKTA